MSVGCWLCLFGGDLIEGNKDARINGSALVHESSIHGLDAFDTGGVQGCGAWCFSWFLLLFGAIDWLDPRVWGGLGSLGRWVLELGEGSIYVPGH